MNSELKRPGAELDKTHLFEQKTIIGEDGEPKIVGFYDPEGNYYDLTKEEELVFIKEGDERNPFIRKVGKDVPFDEWKKETNRNSKE